MRLDKALRASMVITIGLITCFIGESANATGEYWSGGLIPGSVYWFADSSISSSYLSSYVSPGAVAWNGLSSKISLSRIATGSYNIRVLTDLGTDPNTYGLMTSYCTAGSLSACDNSTWTSASITGYENAMAYNNFTTAERIKIYTHEFGHVQSLKHVQSGILSVMVQGRSTIGVQAYDKENIRWRWSK